jgi:hypothetical protein
MSGAGKASDQVGRADAGGSAGQTPSLFGDGPDHDPKVLTGGEGGRKPGRPVGSTNVRQGKVSDFILKTCGDPLIDMVRFSRRDLAGLVRELQAVSKETGVKVLGKNQSLLDIVKEQRAAGEAALPYLHQRKPLAIETDKGMRNVLIVGTPTADQVAQAASTLGLDLRQAMAPAQEIDVEYQELGEDAGEPSPLDASPLLAQPIDNAGE